MLENTQRVMKKNSPEKTGNIGYTRDKTNKENLEKLATQVHKTEEKINVREYGRINENRKSIETGNIGYTRDKINTCQITEGVMKKDNPNKLSAQGS